jgi:hypothetical protein
VTRSASQHHVAWIERVTTITQFDDVVAEEATTHHPPAPLVVGIFASFTTHTLDRIDQ